MNPLQKFRQWYEQTEGVATHTEINDKIGELLAEQPTNQDDMTAKEFFTAPESPFTLDFLNPQEQETFLDAVEWYAKGKVYQAIKATTLENIATRAEYLYPDTYSIIQTDKPLVQQLREAFITGAKEFACAGGDAVEVLEWIEKEKWYFKNGYWYKPAQSIRATHKQLYNLFKSQPPKH